MEIISSIYLLPTIILLVSITELRAIEDPCPDDIDNTIVADMCSYDNAVEDKKTGSEVVDSVVVRVLKQKANCICRVSLNNNAGSYSVYIRKYSALTDSAPELSNCGLAIDVNYLKTTERNKTYPIQCTTGFSNRITNLQTGVVIELKSRIIGGDFTRGYCMQIYRRHYASVPDLQLHIQCDDPDKKTTIPPPYESAMTMNTHKQISTKEIALTTVTEKNAKTSTVTTKEYNKKEEIAPITDTNDNHEMFTVTTKGYNKGEDDQNTNMYIYIGAGAGGVLVIIATLLIIVCIRKRSKKRIKSEKQNAHDNNDPDSDDGKLKDNILYVSADQQDVVEDGNYHTVDLEKKPVVNFGVSDTKTQHVSTFDNSNNEYAVVDKGRQSDMDKHVSTLEVRNSIEKNMEMSGIHVDQTYAVVDKANRGKADE